MFPRPSVFITAPPPAPPPPPCCGCVAQRGPASETVVPDRRERRVLRTAVPRFPSAPRYRAILAIDVEGSTQRTNSAKARIRATMYDLLETALRMSGISACEPFFDRGDGVLVLIRPVDDAPKTALLNSVITTLTGLLEAHNANHAAQGFRMRAVVHAGEVHYDNRGCFGEALDIAFRLLDAPAVKHALARSAAPVVLVVSDDIYRYVIKHGYHGIDRRHFSLLTPVRVAGTDHRGWIHTPGRRHPRHVASGTRALPQLIRGEAGAHRRRPSAPT